MVSSSQSVPGQPVAVPELKPAHHALAAGLSVAILSLRAHELVPRRGDLVALGREGLRRVPDVRLDVGAQRGGVQVSVDRSVLAPVRTEVLVDLVAHGLRGRDGLARVDHGREQARLRDERDVRQVAALGALRKVLLEVLVTFVLDGDAGALLEGLVGLLVRRVLGGDDRGVDADRLAREFGLQVAPLGVVLGVLGGGCAVVRVVAAASTACGDAERNRGNAGEGQHLATL